MPDASGPTAISVIHVFRAPFGGLFRHVCDLSKGQKAAGLKIGIICAAGNSDARMKLKTLQADCELGVHLLPMGRMPGLHDLKNVLRIAALTEGLKPDIIHGHGAKGGAYTRLLPRSVDGLRLYTPHGGSLHYDPKSLKGMAFFNMERFLARRSNGYIFESYFSLRAFTEKVGKPRVPAAVIYNGVQQGEFMPVPATKDMSDFVFVGELRQLKGIATLIEAATLMDRKIHLRIAGDGDDRSLFEQMAADAPSRVRVEFLGAMPAREAFALGRVVVLPSYHESLPYVALEAAAAGKPLIATNVGGLPEIFAENSGLLVQPGNSIALSAAMQKALSEPASTLAAALRLQMRIREAFSAQRMVDEVIGFYRETLGVSGISTVSRQPKIPSSNFTPRVSP